MLRLRPVSVAARASLARPAVTLAFHRHWIYSIHDRQLRQTTQEIEQFRRHRTTQHIREDLKDADAHMWHVTTVDCAKYVSIPGAGRDLLTLSHRADALRKRRV